MDDQYGKDEYCICQMSKVGHTSKIIFITDADDKETVKQLSGKKDVYKIGKIMYILLFYQYQSIE